MSCDGEAGGECDREPFWDECDGHADTVNNEEGNIDPGWVALA